jgi:hypothetical protein
MVKWRRKVGVSQPAVGNVCAHLVSDGGGLCGQRGTGVLGLKVA